MDRKKIIYIGLLLIVTVIVSVTYFSYAFFTRTDEQHGKLNVVVGTLTYKLTSDDLTNNSITLAAKEKKLITIKLKSLNNIASDYKLYYTSSNSNFDIGYSSTTVDATSGTINANGEKTILVSIENKNNSAITINFGVAGGFVGKTLALNTGETFLGTVFDFSICQYQENQEFNFSYTGAVQTFTPECDGRYKLEVWGAQGNTTDSGTQGGLGGYSVGNINLNTTDIISIYAGGQNGYNGGGNGGSGATSNNGGNGGGASDIRIGTDSLYARVIVAGGGGGAGGAGQGGGSSVTSGNGGIPGAGGGQNSIAGEKGRSTSDVSGNGGSAASISSGGAGGSASSASTSNSDRTYYPAGGGGGGGGWYGGGAGGGASAKGNGSSYSGKSGTSGSFGTGGVGGNGYSSVYAYYSGSGGGGAGGSGYVYTSGTASNYPSGCLLNSSYYLTDASTIAGNTSFTAPGGGTETGHSGNGYARITYLGD